MRNPGLFYLCGLVLTVDGRVFFSVNELFLYALSLDCF